MSHIRHYTYEASQHCEAHAIERFSEDALNDGTATDGEGNGVGACFTWSDCEDDYCDDCVAEEVHARWAREKAESIS